VLGAAKLKDTDMTDAQATTAGQGHANTPSRASVKASYGKVLAASLSTAIPILAFLVPTQLDRGTRSALAVALFMVISWMTEVLPHALTGLLGCFLFWALGATTFGTAFSGFVDETTWFYLGVLLFGMMASETGLSRRLALSLLRRVGNSYPNVLLGFIVLSFVLAFIVPSGVACVVIKASVAVGLLQAYGLKAGSNVGRALFITLTYTSGLFDKMVLAGTASILGRGLITKSTGMEVLWSQWLLAYLPLVIITIFVMWRYVIWLYPPEAYELQAGEDYLAQELNALQRWSNREKRALFLLLGALLLWMTDSLHHIPAAMIGLGVGLFSLLPWVGVLDFEAAKQKLNYMSMFFVGSALSLGAVLVKTQALGVLLKGLFGWMAPFMAASITSVLVPYLTALVYHLFLGSELTMLSTSIPALMTFAQANHLNPVSLGMLWTFASGGKIFVYQSAVMIVGYSYGYFDARDVLKVGGFLCLVEGVLIILFIPWYWPLLGL
jgi:sodium-dependent dicarboxylate transporter 2/3/5